MDNLSNPLNLLATNMCSPMVTFVVYVIVSGISLFMTNTALKKYNTQKMETLFNVHLVHEIKLLIVMGVVIYGLCQYNQVSLAWIFLIFPIIYILLKNILIFISVSSARQNAPIQVEPELESSDMFNQVKQNNNDQQRIREQQEDRIREAPPPSVNKNINGMNGGGMNGGGGVMNGGMNDGGDRMYGSLSPPLNSSLSGMAPMGNMADF